MTAQWPTINIVAAFFVFKQGVEGPAEERFILSCGQVRAGTKSLYAKITAWEAWLRG